VFIVKPRKQDRRVVRTRRSLRDALFELIREKGYSAVVVEDITDRADLGRTTFYLHYKNKEDLMLESVRELLDELIGQLSQMLIERIQEERPASELLLSATTLAFQNVKQNSGLYTVILRGEGTHEVMRGLRRIIIQAVSELVQGIAAHQNTALKFQVPVEVFLASLSGSWIGLLTWWLENDMPYSPEEMAEMFTKMYIGPLREALGIRD
jgi:AcrR family transcriptional regulator